MLLQPNSESKLIFFEGRTCLINLPYELGHKMVLHSYEHLQHGSKMKTAQHNGLISLGSWLK